MAALMELISACRAANTDKITERKKQIEEITRQLNIASVRRALNKSGETKGERFGWDKVFKCVTMIIWKESDTLQKAKCKSAGRSGSATQMRGKDGASSLFKLVVQSANKDGSNLKGMDVVHHIASIMKNDFAREAFGLEHTNILVKEILTTRTYVCQVSQAAWQELLCMYVELAVNPPSGWDNVLARVVRVIVDGACCQSDLRAKDVLNTLHEYFVKMRQKNVSLLVLENMVTALNTLCLASAAGSRWQLCRFGENICPAMLYLFNNKPSERLRDELVKFLQLQMTLHHPGGAKLEEDGAFAVQEDVWKSNLRKLYELVYNSLQEFGGRSRFNNNVRDTALSQLKESFVELAADVCHQLFTEQTSAIDVTQASTLDMSNVTKKRRVETGWSVLRDKISAHAQQPTVLPWLQLLACLLTRHPQSLTSAELRPLLACLHGALSEVKNVDIVRHLLICLRCVADSQARLTDGTDACLSMWKMVVAATIRNIGLHRAVESSFLLLTSILRSRLLHPNADLWAAFAPRLCPYSREAGGFLSLCFQRRHLADCGHLLRGRLLDWLFPGADDDGNLPVWPLTTDWTLVAELAVGLTLNSDVRPIGQLTSTSHHQRQHQHMLATIEDCLLHTGFHLDQLAITEQVASSDQCEVTTSGRLTAVGSKLQQLLVRDAQEQLRIPEYNVKVVSQMADCCCLLVKVCGSMLRLGVAKTSQELSQCEVYQCYVALMKRLASSFADVTIKDGYTAAGPIVNTLTQMYRWHGDSNQCRQMASLCRTATPSKLIDHLFKMTSDSSKCKRPSNLSQLPATDGRSFFHSTDVDIHFGDTPSSSADDFDVDFHDFDSVPSESQSSDAFATLPADAGSCSLLSRSLGDADQLRLQTTELLCIWCQHDAPTSGDGSTTCEVVGESLVVKRRLLQMIDPGDDGGGWQVDHLYDLHLMRCLIENLCEPSQCVSEEEIESFLHALRVVCQHHRRDQELHRQVLELLTLIVPHLGATSQHNCSLDSCRSTAVHLFSAFWQLESQYIASTRLALVDCMQAFIQCDVDGEWTKWKLRGGGGGEDGPKQPVVSSFVHLLKDADHQVRLKAASVLHVLFVKRMLPAKLMYNSTHQELMFSAVQTSLKDTIIVQDRLSADEQRDEAAVRSSVCLLAFATIARISERCEKRAVFAICQLSKEHHIEVKLVIKVLTQVAIGLNYPTLASFMSSHLPYLIEQWLTSGHGVEDFPYQLLGFTQEVQFYSECYMTLIPLLVMRKDHASVRAMAAVLERDFTQLMLAALPKVLIHILPLFAVQKSGAPVDGATKQDVAHATTCYDLLLKVIEHQSVEKCITTHLEEIVVDVLMTLHDDSEDQFRATDPVPNPPRFDTATVVVTLDFLASGHGGKEKSLVSLLSKTSDGIQRILLSLTLHGSAAHRMPERLRIMHMYQLFTRMLLGEYAGGLGGGWAFVLRDVIYTLTRTMKASGKKTSALSTHAADIVYICSELLYNISKVSVQHSPQELARFLPVIVSTVVPYVGEKTKIGEKCGELLHMLLVQQCGQLSHAIRLLDPLPRSEPFKLARQVHERLKYGDGGKRWTLRQELEHFLLVSESSVSSAADTRLEAVLALQRQLANNKPQLADLVGEQAQMPSSDLLSKLVCELLPMCQSSDSRLSATASACLAEVGPADLQVVSLRTRSQQRPLATALSHYEDDSLMQRNCRTLHALDAYLLGSSVDTVAAASSVLKRLLSTKSGMAFCSNYKEKVHDHFFQYLHPFKATRKKVTSIENQNTVKQNTEQLDREDLWVPNDVRHDTWITQLVLTMIASGGVTDELLRLLAPICEVKAEFCDELLPYLVHNILLHGDAVHRSVLSRQFRHFFHSHCTSYKSVSSLTQSPICTQTATESPHRNITSNRQSVKTMLSVIQYLRLQERPAVSRARSTPWDNNWWLDIDYLQLAKAAYNCSSSFTALLYAEIWCDTQRSDSQPNSESGLESEAPLSQGGQLRSLVALPHTDTINAQAIMLDAYRRIGDPDGIYGCGAGRLANTAVRIQTYEHENLWSKAVCSYDLEMSQNSTAEPQVRLLKALQNFGATHVLEAYLRTVCDRTDGTDMGSEQIREFQYEMAARNGNWSIDVPARLDENCGYDKAVYSGLRAIRDGDMTMAEVAFNVARSAAVRGLASANLDNARSVYPQLSMLLRVAELQDLACLLKGDLLTCDLLSKWANQDAVLMGTDYAFVEPVMTQRCISLRLALQLGTDNVRSGLVRQLTQLSQLARQAARHQIAERAIFELRHLEGMCEDEEWSWQIEEARVFWGRGEEAMAKHLIKCLSDTLEMKQSANKMAAALYPQCLGIYGNWLAETKSASPDVIIGKYLSKAAELLEVQGVTDDVAVDTFLSLARYTDAQYQQIVSHMSSSTYDAKQSLIKASKDHAEELKKMGDDNTRRYLRTLEKQRVIDMEEQNCLVEDRQRFLLCALRNYLKCLRAGDAHDSLVFRLVSLWFDNNNQVDINTLIQTGIHGIQSHKFLPLMYQLAARMGVIPSLDTNQFQTALNQLIERTVLDHPHHTLFIIFALAHAKKHEEMSSSKSSHRSGRLSSRNSSQDSSQQSDERVTAAVDMLARVRDSQRALIVTDMERLCLAYIELAYLNVEQYKKETNLIALPASLRLRKLKDLTHVAVPTIQTKVDPTGQYADIVYVQSFQPTFKLVGGINLPKIIKCVGSDGVARRQLVKGKDDLRQDAVMQQVFEVVNNMLMKNKETRKRKLSVRTYKVIPLSQRSGLLEWCEGTITIGEYLIGEPNGAHRRYHPDDFVALKCRKIMQTAHGQSPSKTKAEAFAEVCRCFRPVFRHFFMEKFPEPCDWYEKRLAYTRSVATNSIVGYILGLGDRHVQNILIQCDTAELLHIDLGVAFEQGKILPTPETIPFRLTRDIVDGMGVAGVEGVFRRCCEKTMDVMHGCSESLLTILQVLLYDPLYDWTISPLQAYNLQQRRADARNDSTATDVNELIDFDTTCGKNQQDLNKMAERALLRLQQKLQGMEDGRQLSVAGQVSHLIQEARDPANLCRLFPGWQPYI